MADHAKPTTTSHYADFVAEISGRLQDLARGLDPTTSSPTNLPSDAVRWSAASSAWQRWTGSAWVPLSANYAISITGNAGTATKLASSRTINGVAFDGSADIVIADGTKQASSADLTALAGLTSTGLIKRTGVGAAAVVPVTTAGETLLAGANAAAQRTALGLGTAAQVDTGTGDAAVPTNASLRSAYKLRAPFTCAPTLELRFALQSYRIYTGPNGLERFTLTDKLANSRATGASRFNGLRYRENVAAATLRLQHDPATGKCLGLLGETTGKNLISYSSAIDAGSWVKSRVTVTPNAVAGPGGSMTADKVVVAAGTGEASLTYSHTGLVAGGSVSTYVDAMAGEQRYLQIRWFGGTNGIASTYANFDLLTGATAGNATRIKSVPLADGRWRCIACNDAIGTLTSGQDTGINIVSSLSDARRASVTGDGVGGLYIDDVQTEASPYPSSHIETAGSQVTRTADGYTMSTTGWLRAGAGALLVEFTRDWAVPTGATAHVLSLNDGTTSNRIDLLLQRSGSNTVLSAAIAVGGAEVASSAVTITTGSAVRAALTWGSGAAALHVGGALVWSGTGLALPAALSTLSLLMSAAGGSQLNGTVSDLIYCPAPLPASEAAAWSA